MTPAAILPRRQDRRRRATGFTLLELLITIVIISILVGLVAVGLSGPKQAVQVARVRTEIGGLETALSDFKATFNDYPPSRITLCEQASDWNSTNSDILRSKAILRRFWPQFSFGIDRDINQDGTINTTPHQLRGAECLVFFLGGMSTVDGTGTAVSQDRPDTGFTKVGFSKNGSNPFEAQSRNRVGPFFEFNPARLMVTTQSTAPELLVYFDTIPTQQSPYVYASSYDGIGYENLDVQGTSNRLTTSAYRVSATGAFWKDRSFQIISPGFDGQFGTGGEWTEATADTVLTGTNRNVERDNITNFHNTTLAPN